MISKSPRLHAKKLLLVALIASTVTFALVLSSSPPIGAVTGSWSTATSPDFNQNRSQGAMLMSTGLVFRDGTGTCQAQ